MDKKEFKIDLKKTKAPYIFLLKEFEGEKGDKIYKYELRFTQPNKEYLSREAMLFLQSWLEVGLKKHLNEIINISPMSSCTGFTLLILNASSCEEIASALAKTLIEFVNKVDRLNEEDKHYKEAKRHAKNVLDNMSNWSKGAKYYYG